MEFRKELVLNVVVPVLLAIGSTIAALALPKLNVPVPEWLPGGAATFAALCIGWACWMGWRIVGGPSTDHRITRQGGEAIVWGDGSEARGGDGGAAGRGGHARVLGNNSRARRPRCTNRSTTPRTRGLPASRWALAQRARARRRRWTLATIRGSPHGHRGDSWTRCDGRRIVLPGAYRWVRSAVPTAVKRPVDGQGA